jgi:hypothetical protein
MKKELEKKLIRENVEIANVKINQLKKLKTGIAETVIPEFKNLEIGDFSTELLNDVLSNNSAIVSSMVRLQAQDDVRALKTPSVRKTMLQSVEQSLQSFRGTCKTVGNLEGIELLPLIAIIENIVSLVPNAENSIIEGVKEYLNTKEEESLYFALQMACDGLNKAMNCLGVNAASRISDYPELLNFLVFKNGRLEVNNDTDFTALTH